MNGMSSHHDVGSVARKVVGSQHTGASIRAVSVDTTDPDRRHTTRIAESTVYRYSPHEAVCKRVPKRNSRSSGLLPPLSVRTDRRGAVYVYTHTCVMRLTPQPPMSHALTLAAGTRTKEYSSILDYDQRADQHRPASRYPRGACAERSDPRARALWVSSLSQTRMGFVTKSDPRARALDEHLRRDAQLAVDQEEGVSHELWKGARAAARRLHRPQQSRLDLERHDGRAP